VARAWLIRHGQSETNAGGPSSDPAAVPLTPLGHWQAEQVAAAFAGAPALIVTSPYLRARQTVEPTISRFPAVAGQEWPVQEFTYLGELHGRTMTSDEREPYARAYWSRSDPQLATNGAESFADLLRRVTDFLARLRAQGPGPVAVFTHGIFMRAVAWAVVTGITAPSGDDMRHFRRFADSYLVPNGSVVELRYSGDTAQVALSGSTLHLARPPQLAPAPGRYPASGSSS
jgi:2,3-bisphosphoglycerate-dependent phosphoglycerate mutase